MDFQGLISTSNILEEDEVFVETDGPLMWVTELKDDKIAEAMADV